MSEKTKRNARRRRSFCRSNTTRLIIPAKIQAPLEFCPDFSPAEKSPVFSPAAAEVFTGQIPLKQQKARYFARLLPRFLPSI